MGYTDRDGIFRPDRDDRDPYDEDELDKANWSGLRDPHAVGDEEPEAD